MAKGLGFLPFGMGRFECPAKAIVGPMMVGILAGTLVQGLNKGWDLHDDEGKIWNGQLDRGRGVGRVEAEEDGQLRT